MLAQEFPKAFSEALVEEIKVEMTRRRVTSSRKLGELIGQSSQYMSMRLDGGNKKTGERVTLTVVDLILIADALDIAPEVLITRATEAATPSNVTHLSDRRNVTRPQEDDLEAVARARDLEDTDES